MNPYNTATQKNNHKKTQGKTIDAFRKELQKISQKNREAILKILSNDHCDHYKFDHRKEFLIEDISHAGSIPMSELKRLSYEELKELSKVSGRNAQFCPECGDEIPAGYHCCPNCKELLLSDSYTGTADSGLFFERPTTSFYDLDHYDRFKGRKWFLQSFSTPSSEDDEKKKKSKNRKRKKNGSK